MRIHGYCEKCHKIKRVQATGSALAMIATNRVVIGLCSECEDEERAAAQLRHPSRSRLFR